MQNGATYTIYKYQKRPFSLYVNIYIQIKQASKLVFVDLVLHYSKFDSIWRWYIGEVVLCLVSGSS